MVGSSRVGFGCLVALLYAFLLAPILLVVPLSFSGDSYLAFPPSSWSTRWYEALLGHDAMIEAFWVSLGVASTVTGLSLVTGLPAAYALTRGTFPGRDATMTLVTAPLLLPSVILGLAILLAFSRWGLIGTYPGIVLAHLVLTTPYVVRIMSTALSTLPPSVEDAAATLGADPATVFRRVTLPLLVPAVSASAALCFLISFDEVVVSLFVTGPRIATLPVAIFTYVDTRTDPMIAAVSVVLVVGTLSGVVLIERTVGLSRALGGGAGRGDLGVRG
ncbi:MAG: ABC transporter permease [Vicinamibacterales bacterium]